MTKALQQRSILTMGLSSNLRSSPTKRCKTFAFKRIPASSNKATKPSQRRNLHGELVRRVDQGTLKCIKCEKKTPRFRTPFVGCLRIPTTAGSTALISYPVRPSERMCMTTLNRSLAQTQARNSFLSTTPCRCNEMQAQRPTLRRIGACATFAAQDRHC
jgi:hypothetical protein